MGTDVNFKAGIYKIRLREGNGYCCKIPVECDKYNHIQVSLDSTKYEVSIDRQDCREKTYKIGQKVELLKHHNYRELIWPESSPEITMLLIVCVLVYGYFSARKLYRK